MRISIFILCFWLTALGLRAQGYILLPMDEAQSNHLKAYGITYKVLELKQEAWWLLNYRGGEFCFSLL